MIVVSLRCGLSLKINIIAIKFPITSRENGNPRHIFPKTLLNIYVTI